MKDLNQNLQQKIDEKDEDFSAQKVVLEENVYRANRTSLELLKQLKHNELIISSYKE